MFPNILLPSGIKLVEAAVVSCCGSAVPFVIQGEAKLNSNLMDTRDAAKIENEGRLATQAEKPTEPIILDLPEKYADE